MIKNKTWNTNKRYIGIKLTRSPKLDETRQTVHVACLEAAQLSKVKYVIKKRHLQTLSENNL